MEHPFVFFAVGIVVFIFALPAVFKLQKKGTYIHESQKIVEEAKRFGRVVEAKLKKSTYSRGVPGSDKRFERDGMWFCVYTYTVNGAPYYYRTQTGSEPPECVDLYYPEGKPENAIPEGAFKPGTKVTALTLLPVVIWFVLYMIIANFL